MTAALAIAPEIAPPPERVGPGPKTCPRPAKTPYPNKASAWRAAWITTLMSGRALYFYPCHCGHWHLTKDSTSKPSTETTR